MIFFIKGDATQPQTPGNKIIVHICNDIGAWGAGFVLALSKRWLKPERSYRDMPKALRTLGTTQFVTVEQDIIVANMIAQHDIRYCGNIPPIRYQSLRACLTEVNQMAMSLGATIHMPRIGCGLAGGEWHVVEDIITECLPSACVFVYDLK